MHGGILASLRLHVFRCVRYFHHGPVPHVIAMTLYMHVSRQLCANVCAHANGRKSDVSLPQALMCPSFFFH